MAPVETDGHREGADVSESKADAHAIPVALLIAERRSSVLVGEQASDEVDVGENHEA